MARKIIAFILGLLSFFMMFGIGEEFGAAAGFSFVAIYYLLFQFLLSRGNARALPDDWPVILSLNAVMIATAILVLLIEPDAKWTAIVGLVSVGCSMLGAAIAARLATTR